MEREFICLYFELQSNPDDELKRKIFNMGADAFGYKRKPKYDYFLTFDNLIAN